MIADTSKEALQNLMQEGMRSNQFCLSGKMQITCNVLSVTTNQKQLRGHAYKALPCVMICIPHSVNRLIGDTQGTGILSVVQGLYLTSHTLQE